MHHIEKFLRMAHIEMKKCGRYRKKKSDFKREITIMISKYCVVSEKCVTCTNFPQVDFCTHSSVGMQLTQSENVYLYQSSLIWIANDENQMSSDSFTSTH